MARFARVGTIDLRVDDLRPGLSRQFTVTADVLQFGGRIGSVQMRLVNEEGILIATGAGAHRWLRPPPSCAPGLELATIRPT